jgi:hypothetical protein
VGVEFVLLGAHGGTDDIFSDRPKRDDGLTSIQNICSREWGVVVKLWYDLPSRTLNAITRSETFLRFRVENLNTTSDFRLVRVSSHSSLRDVVSEAHARATLSETQSRLPVGVSLLTYVSNPVGSHNLIPMEFNALFPPGCVLMISDGDDGALVTAIPAPRESTRANVPGVGTPLASSTTSSFRLDLKRRGRQTRSMSNLDAHLGSDSDTTPQSKQAIKVRIRVRVWVLVVG